MIKKTKNCANPACKLPFEYKNPKKRFCNLYCKNQAAYLYQQKNYEWEIKMIKARRKNIQILEYLLNKNITRLNLEELNKMGFDGKCAYIPIKDENQLAEFRYGNIAVRILSKTECEIFNLK